MSPLDEFLEFTAPHEFEAAIPQRVKDRLAALTKEELMHRFDNLWCLFLGEIGPRPSLEERQEYFIIKKDYLKIPG
jgi:hypothetical protein